jgi:hypothetical protein
MPRLIAWSLSRPNPEALEAPIVWRRPQAVPLTRKLVGAVDCCGARIGEDRPGRELPRPLRSLPVDVTRTGGCQGAVAPAPLLRGRDRPHRMPEAGRAGRESDRRGGKHDRDGDDEPPPPRGGPSSCRRHPGRSSSSAVVSAAAIRLAAGRSRAPRRACGPAWVAVAGATCGGRWTRPVGASRGERSLSHGPRYRLFPTMRQRVLGGNMAAHRTRCAAPQRGGRPSRASKPPRPRRRPVLPWEIGSSARQPAREAVPVPALHTVGATHRAIEMLLR